MEQSVILGLLAMVALLVRVGLALYTAGLTRSKNSAGAVLRAVCDLCTAALAYLAVGWAIQWQITNDYFWADFDTTPAGKAHLWHVLLSAVTVLASTGIVAGALGERSRFFSGCAASALLAGLVVPAAARWVYRYGWLAKLGYVDVGGSGWLHVTGGVCAAAGAYLVGPRQGKYHRDGSASVIPGHSLPLAAVGVLIMMPGWIAYVAGWQEFKMNGGADRAALNVLLGGAAGGLAALLYGQSRFGKPDVLLTLSGLLGGLVAVSAGAGRIPFPWAAAVGAVAGVLVPWAAVWIDLRLRIDDPTAAVAIHAVGGAWGLLAAGMFLPGDVAGRLRHVGVQAVGLAATAALAGGLSFGLFLALKRAGVLRSKEADEFDGLDLAEHDIAAYPDFQQNTIRSYHMREA